MEKYHIKAFNTEMELLAIIENATQISYYLERNKLGNGSFSLAKEDEKNQYLLPFNFVEMYDNTRLVGLFRIIKIEEKREIKNINTYYLEHVLATLIDDMLSGYHVIGNVGMTTSQCLQYVLAHQTKKRWELEYFPEELERMFQYNFENQDLYKCFFAILQPLTKDYNVRYNTKNGDKWYIRVELQDSEFKADIMYGKNMVSMQKHIDATRVVTELTPLGYGEGDNMVNISSVNNGEKSLIASTVGEYGLIKNVLVDRRFQNPTTLKAYGEKVLNELKNPYISYSLKAVDLNRVDTNYEAFETGDIVRVFDKIDDVVLDLPIISVSKKDVSGSPWDVDLVIGNKAKNVAQSIAEISSRQRIEQLYAQGATNQFMVNFADNADTNHPATLHVYIPDTLERINIAKLFWELLPFRGYTNGVTSAPATISSGSSINSSLSGGGNSVSSSGGGAQYTSSSSGGGVSTSSGSASLNVSSTLSGGGTNSTVLKASWQSEPFYGDAGVLAIAPGLILNQYGVQPHSHGFNPSHIHDFVIQPHSHGLNIPSHNHTISIGSHSHDVSFSPHVHNVQVPSHSHGIGHTHNLPQHTHDTKYGIYEGSIATNITIKVDDTIVPEEKIVQGLDLVDYFAKDESGKILRNYNHKVQVIPNDLTRIESEIFMQVFTNSRGGGDY